MRQSTIEQKFCNVDWHQRPDSFTRAPSACFAIVMDAKLRDRSERNANVVALQQSNPPRPSEKRSSFVVGKLTSVNHRATLFHAGD
jgi:hypothetical protein